MYDREQVHLHYESVDEDEVIDDARDADIEDVGCLDSEDEELNIG